MAKELLLVEDGIPFTSFGVRDVEAEHTRLEGLGVKFAQPPATFGDVTTAVFDGTCGNLIQIAQQSYRVPRSFLPVVPLLGAPTEAPKPHAPLRTFDSALEP